eukprot:GDKK01040429.1.p1 GENE.GDKK01040429.1~~GDKK01040429.1.p1  ORF type:complete len:343 (-),score=1.83 GDKK01040429.1:191-1219(-)
MGTLHERYNNTRVEKFMFLEICKDRDIAMMNVEDLGPKMATLSPPKPQVSLLSGGAWNPDQVTMKRVDLSEWEGTEKFCIILDNVLTPEECKILIDHSERKGYEPALVNVGGNRQLLLTDTRNNDRCILDDPRLVEDIWQRVLRATAEKDPSAYDALVHVPWINERNQRRNNGKTFQAVGLNERMRYLRYDPGTFFAPHYDGSYVRAGEAGAERSGEQSFITFQLYLNEGFQGGSTRFVPPNEEIEDESDGEAEKETETASGNSWFSFLTKRGRTKKTKGGYKVIPRTGSVLLFQHDCLHEGARVREGRKYAVRTDVMYTSRGPGLEYAQQPILARQLDDMY